VPHGDVGDLVVTCLFSEDLFPLIRFNSHDLTRFLPGPSALRFPFRRMEGFLGRSDSMVKLRGINVFPQALSSILAGSPGFNGEYICTLTRHEGREDLLVSVECTVAPAPELVGEYRGLLRRQLGVEVDVELVAPRSLSPLTGVETRQKPIRLLDKR